LSIYKINVFYNGFTRKRIVFITFDAENIE
jgi:hypothetical protein